MPPDRVNAMRRQRNGENASGPVAVEGIARNLAEALRKRADENLAAFVVVGGPAAVAFLPEELIGAGLGAKLRDTPIKRFAGACIPEAMNNRDYAAGAGAR
jgi:hypothetical protein